MEPPSQLGVSHTCQELLRLAAAMRWPGVGSVCRLRSIPFRAQLDFDRLDMLTDARQFHNVTEPIDHTRRTVNLIRLCGIDDNKRTTRFGRTDLEIRFV